MAFFPLLNNDKPSLLLQLSKKVNTQDKKGIHIIEINQLAEAEKQAKALIKAHEEEHFDLLVWIVPALKESKTLSKALSVLDQSGAPVSIIFYPPLLEFILYQEQQIKTERLFLFPFEKLAWSSLKEIKIIVPF